MRIRVEAILPSGATEEFTVMLDAVPMKNDLINIRGVGTIKITSVRTFVIKGADVAMEYMLQEVRVSGPLL